MILKLTRRGQQLKGTDRTGDFNFCGVMNDEARKLMGIQEQVFVSTEVVNGELKVRSVVADQKW